MKRFAILMVGLVLSGPVLAQGQFDGAYRNPNGTMGTGSCITTRFGFGLNVQGGVATLRTATAGTLEGKVGADGSVQLQSGPTLLSGKIAANRFTGDLSMGRNGTCHFPLDYTKG